MLICFFLQIITQTLSQLAFTCSKVTIETLKNVSNILKVNNKKHQNNANWCRFGVFNFEHISQLVLVFVLLTLNM